MSNSLLSCVEINPKETSLGSVIWLHGLGADGYDFADIIPKLKLPKNLPLNFIFPHANIMPITINGGVPMRAWYDFFSMDFNAEEDEKGIRHSQQLINDLIMAEIEKGILAKNIVLIGFSQGAAMVLQTGLRYPESLGGIISLSGYLPLHSTLLTERHPANQSTPILLLHGEYDDVVLTSWGKSSKDFLKKANYSVEWQTYPIGHSVCQEEAETIGKWLTQRINPQNQVNI